MHAFFCQWHECVDSWILVIQNGTSLQSFDIHRYKGFYQKRGNCKNPILYLPISRIPCPSYNTTLVYQKQLWISEPKRRFGTSPNLNQSPRAHTRPSELMHPSKRCMHPPLMHTPLQHAQNCLCASKRRMPLQRGVHLLTGSICKVETNP